MVKFVFLELKKAVSLDLRGLAFIRILLGVFLLADLTTRITDLKAFYTTGGVLPIPELYNLTSLANTFSFHTMNGTIYWQAFMFILTAIFAIGLIIGYRTTLMTFLCWIMIVSMQNRNPVILQGGDVVVRMTFFWCMFLPLGARFSWDRFRAKANKILHENRYTSLATFALIAQIAMIYFFAALLKTGAEWRSEYSAVYYALSLESFSTWIGELYLKVPEVIKVLTFAVWWFEFSVAFLLHFPLFNRITRTIGAMGIIGFHSGIGTAMILGPFPLISSIVAIALFPTEFWDFIEKRISKFHKKEKIKLVYNNQNEFQFKLYRFFKTFGILRDIEYEIDEKAERFYVVKEKDKYFGEEAAKILLNNSLLFFKLRNMVHNRFVHKIYSFAIAKQSKFNSTHPDNLNPETYHESTLQYFIFNLTASVALMFVFVWNLSNETKKTLLESPFRDIVLFARWDQQWNMFAPYPLKEDGWFIITGFTNGGQEVNLFGDDKENKYDKPDDVSSEFKNERWRKYLMNLWQKSYANYRPHYTKYLCNNWNDSHEDKLSRVEMEFMLQRVRIDGKDSPEAVKITTYTCPVATV